MRCTKVICIYALVAGFSTTTQAQWWSPDGNQQTATPRYAAEPTNGYSNYPVNHARRPLTLPKMMLQVDAAFEFVRVASVSPGLSGTSAFGITAGGAFGITDDLTVGAQILDLRFDDFDYEDIDLWLLYRFLGQTGDGLQLAGRLQFFTNWGGELINLNGSILGGSWATALGLDVLIAAGGVFRLDTGIQFVAVFQDFSDNWFITFPVRATINLGDHFYIGANLPLHTDFDVLIMPLLFRAGYTVGNDQPVADIELVGGFPGGLLVGNSTSDFVTEFWGIGINGRIYIDL